MDKVMPLIYEDIHRPERREITLNLKCESRGQGMIVCRSLAGEAR